MKFILGKKLHMSQIYSKEGHALPVTLVEAGPITVTQVRNLEKDNYEAVQFGFGKKKRLNKPLAGHLKDLGAFRFLKEFRTKGEKSMLAVGDKVDVSIFKEGDIVNVASISKGKGFQGAMKRHGFHGAPRTHGTKHAHREVGSIGSTWPQRVLKGTRMAGRMGGERVTIKNLKVVRIDKENNLIAIRGAVPGIKGALLEIRGRQ